MLYLSLCSCIIISAISVLALLCSLQISHSLVLPYRLRTNKLPKIRSSTLPYELQLALHSPKLKYFPTKYYSNLRLFGTGNKGFGTSSNPKSDSSFKSSSSGKKQSKAQRTLEQSSSITAEPTMATIRRSKI